ARRGRRGGRGRTGPRPARCGSAGRTRPAPATCRTAAAASGGTGSLQVAFDLVRRPYPLAAGVLAGLPPGAAAAQQVPALVQRDLQLLQPPALLRALQLAALVPLAEPLLLGDVLADAREDLLLAGRAVSGHGARLRSGRRGTLRPSASTAGAARSPARRARPAPSARAPAPRIRGPRPGAFSRRRTPSSPRRWTPSSPRRWTTGGRPAWNRRSRASSGRRRTRPRRRSSRRPSSWRCSSWRCSW